MIWLGFAIGALGGLLTGAIIGSYIGRERMRDEMESLWWKHLRREKAGMN